jgi:hypothetical protein
MDAAQARWMVALSVLVLGLTGLWTWMPDAGPDASDATARVWEPRTEGVKELVLRSADGEVALARADSGWRLVRPIQDRADPARVDAALADLQRVAFGIPVAGPDADGSPYGLGATPQVHVSLSYDDGRSADLQFGTEAPTGYRTYARDQSGSVVAVPGRPTRQLVVEADAWRDTRVWDLPLGALRGLRIRTAAGTLDVHGAGRSWWLQGASRANPDRVDDLAVSLADLRLERFEDVTVDSAEREVEATLADGTVSHLRFGQVGADGLVPVVGGRAVGRMHAAELAVLGSGPTDVAETRAFAFDSDGAERVSVVAGGHTYEAVREADRWTGSGDAGAWVTALADADVVAGPTPWADPVWAVVRVRSGADEVAVEVGGLGSDGLRVARDLAGGLPYRVRDADLAPLSALIGSDSVDPR